MLKRVMYLTEIYHKLVILWVNSIHITYYWC